MAKEKEAKEVIEFPPQNWDQIFAQLSKPFSQEQVMFRLGAVSQAKHKSLALAYIDARLVMDRLNEIFGPYWQSRHYDCGNGKIACEIKLFINGEWVSRTDGAGGTQVEADKGSFSDAFKRAAVSWGIGRYLYDFPDHWVDLTPDNRRFTDEAKAKLKTIYKNWADKGFAKLQGEEEPTDSVPKTSSDKLKATFLSSITSAESLDALKSVGKLIGDKKSQMTETDVEELIKSYRDRESELNG